jgi:hypothetical protein
MHQDHTQSRELKSEDLVPFYEAYMRALVRCQALVTYKGRTWERPAARLALESLIFLPQE